MRSLFLAIAAVAMATAPLAPSRAEGYAAAQLLSTTTTIIGEPIVYPTTGPARVTAAIVTVAPGDSTIPHHHGAPLFAYILEGEVTVDYGPPHGVRTLKKGDSMVEALASSHRGRNLGQIPVAILAVYMGADGTRNVIADK
ncbi:MAG: cupin domain-containing protein [Alphaproteobacteria bacterium]|nr:cupin domain-containing protein [Alphaproteobacteria bacterium]